MKARCPRCGRIVRCRVPAGGDGSASVYDSHLPEKLGSGGGRFIDDCEWSRHFVKTEDYIEEDYQ